MSNPNIGVLANLPSHLAYLAAPAMRYGVHHFDSDMDAFLSAATDEETEELAALAEKIRLNKHYAAVNAWLDEYKITQYDEAAHLYFLFGLLDMAGLDFDGE